MKTAKDPRHQIRRKVVKELFSQSFTSQKPISLLSKKVLEASSEIDSIITEAAPSWPLEMLNKVDLAILRLAIYELRANTAPPKVIIDEAVELAKEFGSENSASFVNGVLGKIYSEGKNEK